ncbi:MAG: hypothetical protein RPR97_06645 [Colwellia sp.]
MNNDLLIIGRPASGKTTFLAQFLTRVRKKKSSVKLSKVPENIKAISDAQRRLAAGKEPNTTPANSNEVIELPLLINDKEVQLSCPDYGGEQVNSLMQSMAIDTRWQTYVNESGSWVLFIRPNSIALSYDITISVYKDVHGSKLDKNIMPELSDQCLYIELIQALLCAKKVSIRKSIQIPKLTIALTCWDELETDKCPKEFLKEKMPLFLQFIETNWASSKFEVLGLSAQEFSLIDNPEGSDKYQDELPENIGYLILPDGTRDKDITKLIEKALI